MKKLLICLSFIVFAAATGKLRAQDDEVAQDYDIHACKLPATPNIVDYFEAAVPHIHPAQWLMESALEVVRGKAENPESFVAEKVVDLRNGFVSVTMGWNEDARHVETCYWRMNDRDDGHQRALLGVYFFWPGDDSAIRFFEFDRTAGTLRAVPLPFNLPRRFEEYTMLYELPRRGKTIKAKTYGEVTPEYDPIEIEFTFNGTNFDTEFVNLKPEIEVYPVFDGDETSVGIYNEGERYTAIGRKDAEFCFLVISDPREGWWRIKDAWLEVGDLTPMLDVRGGQINYKNVGAEARNYDGTPIPLHAGSSADSEVVFSIGNKPGAPINDYYPPLLRLIDMSDDGEWVKVEVRDSKSIIPPTSSANASFPNDHGGIGWIETFWICGNPLTNCN